MKPETYVNRCRYWLPSCRIGLGCLREIYDTLKGPSKKLKDRANESPQASYAIVPSERPLSASGLIKERTANSG